MQRIVLLLLFCMPFYTSAAPLPAKEVFRVSTKVQNPNSVLLSMHAKMGYFLYKNRTNIASQNTSSFKIADISYPKGSLRTNHLGHTVSIYRGITNIPVKIKLQKAGIFFINVKYQGCSDEGFCYPPQNQKIELTISDGLQLVDSQIVSNDKFQVNESFSYPTQEQEIKTLFSQHHHAVVLLIFFGFGLLLSFTPCVLPMIPVLSSIIVGQGKDMTTLKAVLISSSFVLSMALTYAVIGALIAKIGANLQLLMQSNIVIALFSIVFVLLSLSMFGAYELKLPTSWQSKLTNVQRKQNRGHYLGAAVMGCLSTLILSPCVTAPLIGALSYIAQTGKVLFGSLALFSLGLGMGAPLLIIGASAGRFLPKTGQWMNQVKFFFGILLLAIAIYLASRILPGLFTMLLWGGLAIFSGIWASTFQPRRQSIKRAGQAGSLLLLSYGILIFISAALGSRDPVKPLSKMVYHHATTPSVNQQHIVHSSLELKQAIKKAYGQPVFIDFYADWCASCKAMDNGLLQKETIRKALNHFTVIKADITRLGVLEKDLLRDFGVIAPPTFVFLNTHGKELKEHRLVGEQSEESLARHLDVVSH